MFTAKKQKVFLLQLFHDQVKAKAANKIRRVSLKTLQTKRRKKIISSKEVNTVVAARKQKSLDLFFEIFGRILLHDALAAWKKGNYEARNRSLQKILVRRSGGMSCPPCTFLTSA